MARVRDAEVAAALEAADIILGYDLCMRYRVVFYGREAWGQVRRGVFRRPITILSFCLFAESEEFEVLAEEVTLAKGSTCCREPDAVEDDEDLATSELPAEPPANFC